MESLRLTQLRFDNGAVSELDLRLAQSVVSSARAALAQVQRGRALDESTLVLPVGAPLPADLPAGAGSLGEMAAFPTLPVGLPASVLQRRPDILSAEQQLIAANFNIGAARAAYFPQVSITASAGTVSADFSGLFKGGTWGWRRGAAGAADAVRRRPQPSDQSAGRVHPRRCIGAVRQGGANARFAKWPMRWPGATRWVKRRTSCRRPAGREADALSPGQSALQQRGGQQPRPARRAALAVHRRRQLALAARLAQAQNQVTLYKVLGGGWTETTTTSKAP